MKPHKTQLLPILLFLLTGCGIVDTETPVKFSEKYTSYLDWKETNEKHPDINGDNTVKNSTKTKKDTSDTDKSNKDSNKSSDTKSEKDSTKTKKNTTTTSKKNTKKTSKKSTKKNTNKNTSKNSSSASRYKVSLVSDTANSEGQIVYNVKNTGARAVSVTVVAHFYDDDGIEIAKASDSILSLEAGESMLGFIDNDGVPEDYSTYKLKVAVGEVNSINSMKRNVLYSQGEDNTNVSITGKNNATAAISSMVFNVIFMDDERPVICQTLTLDNVQPGADFEGSLPNPTDSDSNGIEYNNYTISLKDAFSYA